MKSIDYHVSGLIGGRFPGHKWHWLFIRLGLRTGLGILLIYWPPSSPQGNLFDWAEVISGSMLEIPRLTVVSDLSIYVDGTLSGDAWDFITYCRSLLGCEGPHTYQRAYFRLHFFSMQGSGYYLQIPEWPCIYIPVGLPLLLCYTMTALLVWLLLCKWVRLALVHSCAFSVVTPSLRNSLPEKVRKVLMLLLCCELCKIGSGAHFYKAIRTVLPGPLSNEMGFQSSAMMVVDITGFYYILHLVIHFICCLSYMLL